MFEQNVAAMYDSYLLEKADEYMSSSCDGEPKAIGVEKEFEGYDENGNIETSNNYIYNCEECDDCSCKHWSDYHENIVYMQSNGIFSDDFISGETFQIYKEKITDYKINIIRDYYENELFSEINENETLALVREGGFFTYLLKDNSFYSILRAVKTDIEAWESANKEDFKLENFMDPDFQYAKDFENFINNKITLDELGYMQMIVITKAIIRQGFYKVVITKFQKIN